MSRILNVHFEGKSTPRPSDHGFGQTCRGCIFGARHLREVWGQCGKVVQVAYFILQMTLRGLKKVGQMFATMTAYCLT